MIKVVDTNFALGNTLTVCSNCKRLIELGVSTFIIKKMLINVNINLMFFRNMDAQTQNFGGRTCLGTDVRGQ